jgi:DNA-directed RNA polymerase subunit omega
MPLYSNEDAVKRIPNRFELVLISAQRVRELRAGAEPYVKVKGGVVTTALAEIEQGHIKGENISKLMNTYVQANNHTEKRS